MFCPNRSKHKSEVSALSCSLSPFGACSHRVSDFHPLIQGTELSQSLGIVSHTQHSQASLNFQPCCSNRDSVDQIFLQIAEVAGESERRIRGIALLSRRTSYMLFSWLDSLHSARASDTLRALSIPHSRLSGQLLPSHMLCQSGSDLHSLAVWPQPWLPAPGVHMLPWRPVVVLSGLALH